MNAQAYELEPQESRHKYPEEMLWLAALALLVQDARRYVVGQRVRDAEDETGEVAYGDLMQCGPMVCHLCSMTGHDPLCLCEGFRAWLVGRSDQQFSA